MEQLTILILIVVLLTAIISVLKLNRLLAENREIFKSMAKSDAVKEVYQKVTANRADLGILLQPKKPSPIKITKTRKPSPKPKQVKKKIAKKRATKKS